MHIHGNSLNSQSIALGPTQGTQQAIAARKAAAEVRRKLTSLATIGEDDVVNRAEARSDSNPDRRQNPQQQDELPFRSVFFSASV